MIDKALFQLFVNELEDMYSSEHQIVKALPKLIKAAQSTDLRDALSHHLEETEHQVSRIEQIFSILKITPQEEKCQAMEGILKEGDEILRREKTKSPVTDAAIISAAQKVEHYEIASYGTLRSFAKHLELDSEVVSLIQAILDEEGAADKKLTKLADGSLFTTGLNTEAASGSKKIKNNNNPEVAGAMPAAF